MKTAKLFCQEISGILVLQRLTDKKAAIAAAIKLARQITGRQNIITIGSSFLEADEQLPYNNVDFLQAACAATAPAAIFIEPVPTKSGLLLPSYGYLEEVRQIADDCGALLIFDESVTIRHCSLGGAQNLYDVEPDLTIIDDTLCSSKTFSQRLSVTTEPYWMPFDKDAHYFVESMTAILTGNLERAAKAANVPVHINRLGNMFSLYFSSVPVVDVATAVACDSKAYATFRSVMEQAGFTCPASQLTTNFVTEDFTAELIQKITDAAAIAFLQIAQSRT